MYEIRDATVEDLPLVRHTIFVAMSWNPARQLPQEDHLVVHPELARYHSGWGREGDIGVVATRAAAAVGMAFCRLFAESDHGEGFVDPQTPELVIGVEDGHRNAGLGARLLEALADRARSASIEQLSLSVDAANPAARLYPRLGYELIREDAHGLLMRKRL